MDIDNEQDPLDFLEVTINDASDSNDEEDNDIISISETSSSSSSLDLESADENNFTITSWRTPATGYTLKCFIFNDELFNYNRDMLTYNAITPYHVYSKFLCQDILMKIVEYTNNHVQNLIQAKIISVRDWRQKTDINEIKKFFGILMYMNCVVLPKISDYWRSDDLIHTQFCTKIMTKDRFQMLLKYIQFTHHDQKNSKSATCEIDEILDLIISKFKQYKCPGGNIVISKNVIPLQGIPQDFNSYTKCYEQNITFYKLTDPVGYTYNIYIDTRTKSKSKSNCHVSKSTQICLDLVGNYLNTGRTLTIHNDNISIELARTCLSNSTHIQGLLLPYKELLNFSKMIKYDKCLTMEENGIVIGIWKNKHNKLNFLSTKHHGQIINPSSEDSNSKHNAKKPDVIFEYNKCIQSINTFPNQLASSAFHGLLWRNSINWHHMAICEILLTTAVVNSFLLFHESCTSLMDILKFREDLIRSLILDVREEPDFCEESNFCDSKHELIETEIRNSRNRKIRRRCRLCYAEAKLIEGVKPENSKQVTTFCKGCPEKPFLCLKHFGLYHKNKK